jgi:hypothetical protein
MTRQENQVQPASISFRIPNFVGDDGTVFTEIEVTVQSEDGDIHDAVQLVKTLEASTERRQ